MKRLSRGVIALICVLSMAFCWLAACGPADNGNVDYVVTVTCPDSDELTIELASVKLIDDQGNDVTDFTALTVNSKTKSMGSVTFSVAPGKYKVVIKDIPPKYVVPDTVLTPTIRTATINLAPEGQEPVGKIEYKITLRKGLAPVPDVQISVCGITLEDAACHEAETDSNGVATLILDAKEYEIHIDKSYWPAGYMFDNTFYHVTAAAPEIEVEFSKKQTYTVNVVYAETKDNTGATVAERGAAGIELAFDRERSGVSYVTASYTGTTDSSGVCTLELPAAAYRVRLLNIPTGYNLSNSGNIIESTEEKEDPDITFTLREPGSDWTSRIGIVADTDYTININAKAQSYWFEFVPQGKSGLYQIESSAITSSDNIDPTCLRFAGTGSTFNDQPQSMTGDLDDISVSDKNFRKTFEIWSDELNDANFVALRIGASDLPTPVGTHSFKIRVTWLEARDRIEIPTTYPTATQIKSAVASPAGKTYKTANINSDTIVYNSYDGYYHRNTTDGEIIFVAIAGTKYAVLGSDKSVYNGYQEANGIGFTFSDGETYKHDYGTFLKAYADAANADGLTPLTEELMKFLETYAEFNHNTDLIGGWDYATGRATKTLYFFACGYFA